VVKGKAEAKATDTVVKKRAESENQRSAVGWGAVVFQRGFRFHGGWRF